MFRKSINISLVVALVLSAVFAQQPASAPSVERLRTHINYLASDKLEGRRTGSEGANLAAEYIAKEFSRYGLQRSIGWDTPGMSILEADSPNRYLQKFPYVAGVELGKGNRLSFSIGGNITNLEIGSDWMPLGLSTNAQLEKLPVSFVGFGITSSELDDRLAQLRYDNSAGDAGLPVIVISRVAAAKMLSEQDTSKLGFLERETRRVSLYKIAPPPGWTPEKESFFIIAPQALSLATVLIRREVEAANVVGIVNGFDPVLKNEFIVIGAHYDHLGRGGEGSLAPREGDIHHGADDNASGVAGLLELARIFASSESPRPRRTLVFIAFSGEEEGLLGSNYYVNHPLRPLENTVAMINMDMIGRMKNNKLIVGGVGTAEGWRKVIDSSAKFWGIGVTPTPPSYGKPLDGALTAKPESSTARTSHSADRNLTTTLDSVRAFDLTLNEDGYGPSDHSSFYAKKVPVLFIWTGTHEDYHKPSDTADKINYEDEAHILSFVERIIRSVDASDARPVYTVAKSESQGRTMGFRVYLGTIPNYADSGDGLLLDGVRDDSPAAKAGIKAGDRIVKLAGRDVHNVYDYTYALGEMKAGQDYEVELVRAGERMKLRITPAARK